MFYVNTPLQYNAIFSYKNGDLQMKNCYSLFSLFLLNHMASFVYFGRKAEKKKNTISAQNIDCG